VGDGVRELVGGLAHDEAGVGVAQEDDRIGRS
jgi:hypothetical protein